VEKIPVIGRHVILMVKEPRAGRVKTRLGADIGMIEAAWWYRHQVACMIRRLDSPKWTLWMAVTPDTALRSPVWSSRIPRVAQGSGDLGERMLRLLGGAPKGPTVIVGTDIPGLKAAHIARAFHLLGDNDAVFGPCLDGGYWLVGLKRNTSPSPTMFRNVRWSTPYALADSVATLSGRRVAMADTLADVDTAADLSA